MFLVIGAGGLLWLVPWWILVPADKPEEQTAVAAAAEAKENDTQLRALFGTPLIWGVLTGTFCYNYFQYFCLTWLPAYFVEHRNLPPKSMGLYTAFTFGGMAVVAAAAGWGADRMIASGRDPALVRRGFTVAGFLVASTALIGGWSDSRTVALTFAIVSLSGLGLATANYWALTQTLLPGKAIGRIAGIQNMASNLAGIAAPVITGLLKEATGSYLAAFQAVAFFMVLGLVSYLFLVRRKFVPREFLPARAM
jgi:nitrate/nitrite transporter NarK